MNWQAKSSTPLTLPSSWQQLERGESYCNAISQYFSSWSTKILGQQLVRLGGLSAELDCNMALPYHFVLSPEIQDNLTALSNLTERCNQKEMMLMQSDLVENVELPFESLSTDVCIMAHTLNFSQDPHQLLREIQRILTDDGFLFLSIINPFSPLLFKGNLGNSALNETFKFRHFLPFRVIDWLELLNFEVLKSDNIGGGMFPPIRVIIAQKRTYPLSLQPQKVRFNSGSIFEKEPVGVFAEKQRAEIKST